MKPFDEFFMFFIFFIVNLFVSLFKFHKFSELRDGFVEEFAAVAGTASRYLRDLLVRKSLLKPQEQDFAAGVVEFGQRGGEGAQLVFFGFAGIIVFVGAIGGGDVAVTFLGGFALMPNPPRLLAEDIQRFVARCFEEPVAKMVADGQGLLTRERHKRLLHGILRKRVVAQETGGEA